VATPQCPECARFLAGAFVAGLEETPAPCPGCAVLLGPGPSVAAADAAPAAASGAASAGPTEEPDVPADPAQPSAAGRDPVADPGATPDASPEVTPAPAGSRDPLAGWDPDGPPDLLPQGGPTLPEPAVAGALAGGGLLLGLLLAGRGRRGRGALLGLLAGLLATAAQVLRGPTD
jgi:hypothetical protein